MKHKLALFGMVGLASLVLTSFTLRTDGDQKEQPKKMRHLKMTKIENGKKTELDTVLTNDNVFVWKGDTINPGKHIGSKGSDKMQTVNVTVDNKDGNEKVMILRHGDEKPGDPMMWDMDSGDDMDIVTEDVDSLGKRIVVRKHIEDGNDMVFRNCPHRLSFPSIPPMPKHSGQVIDLNDPNVISYKKKDLSGGREKIEIIRKKSDKSEEMTFDFDANDMIMPPPPPPAPEGPYAPQIIREYKDGRGNVKIIEKSTKVEGKDGKEIKVEVESSEEK
jgi:hypothetical protein